MPGLPAVRRRAAQLERWPTVSAPTITRDQARAALDTLVQAVPGNRPHDDAIALLAALIDGDTLFADDTQAIAQVTTAAGHALTGASILDKCATMLDHLTMDTAEDQATNDAVSRSMRNAASAIRTALGPHA